MKKKRYSDISFLPAFLVPSTVMKFLFGRRPVDRLPRSVLTVSHEEKKTKNKESPSKESANPFIFHFKPHTPTHFVFYLHSMLHCVLVSSIKGNQIQYILI